jgi:hypothetical protein
VEVYFTAIFPSVGRGDFAAARQFARVHDERNERLSSHHRLHGVAVLVEVEELAGDWERISALEERIEESVDANLSTPCVKNARSLYLAALARRYRGENEEAQRLEARADEVSLEGYGLTLDALRMRLAVARGDLAMVERLAAAEHSFSRVFHLGSEVGLLEGLTALSDRKRIEAEAQPLLKPGTYLEPFALRALGLAREDKALVEQALARFEALGLDWYAAQTRKLATS